MGIAIDGAEHMFVADPYNHRVQVYDITSGTPVYSATLGIPGECGSDDDHFCYPWRVATDSLDQLYVADADNGRVQQCIYSGGWSCALFDSGLFRPRGITVDSSDNVFISDTETGNNRIRKCVVGFR
jgi:DNA-binding beta-propeller fold protein YncE